MALYILEPIYFELINYCISKKPMEACGLLSGANQMTRRLWPILNTDNSPVSFTMDVDEHREAIENMKSSSEQLCAIFHSHPNAPPIPSKFDIQHAFIDCSYVIVSLASNRPKVRSYKITDGTAHRENIYIVKN